MNGAEPQQRTVKQCVAVSWIEVGDEPLAPDDIRTALGVFEFAPARIVTLRVYAAQIWRGSKMDQ